MPFLPTAQSWLTESTLLLEARPSTTRITSKYTISPLPSTSPTTTSSKPNKTRRPADPLAPRATLTLKTFDPVSGTTLKYETNKAAEVSRLVQILGRLARPMAGLEMKREEEEAVIKEEGEEVKEGGGGAVVVAAAAKGGAQQQQQQQQQGGGKGKGKKKGKR
ncbi:WD repeat protein [Drepanopeziza brunnea f. sp. 'multigermtubi' MB_m1]|uniref:WD repeat protein n=1 Tax=Marssonina brunnea f. sp. multigermtubi (strain MB_m1) TaxID=1072389 RepID=K1XI78_MARBU|nr:WD repeat protein [Drepanopeziza brunnea f. sp. 'multigermtubi' MB_m1]EKD20443.1 WD repeat protein [Drepanopeziza brunnea f. sp. 'multigermtubi' MB_m1]